MPTRTPPKTWRTTKKSPRSTPKASTAKKLARTFTSKASGYGSTRRSRVPTPLQRVSLALLLVLSEDSNLTITRCRLRGRVPIRIHLLEQIRGTRLRAGLSLQVRLMRTAPVSSATGMMLPPRGSHAFEFTNRVAILLPRCLSVCFNTLTGLSAVIVDLYVNGTPLGSTTA